MQAVPCCPSRYTEATTDPSPPTTTRYAIFSVISVVVPYSLHSVLQPSSTPAFSNTIYVPQELRKLQSNTPTSLVETYYSCVLAPWPAFYTAVGLGAASVGVWIPLAFAVYMFLSVKGLNMFFNAKIPSVKEKVSPLCWFCRIVWLSYILGEKREESSGGARGFSGSDAG